MNQGRSFKDNIGTTFQEVNEDNVNRNQSKIYKDIQLICNVRF